MKRFRPQRVTLAEALDEMVAVRTREELLRTVAVMIGRTVSSDEVDLRHYGFDARIGWDTWMVTWRGMCVGYTDGPIAA